MFHANPLLQKTVNLIPVAQLGIWSGGASHLTYIQQFLLFIFEQLKLI